MDQKQISIAYAEIMNRCWEDPAYLERFRSDPGAVLEEYGIPTLAGVRYHVVDQTPGRLFIILPKDAPEDCGEKTTAQLRERLGGSFKGEIKVLQNTETDAYLIYQTDPGSFELTDEQLDAISAGGFAYTETSILSYLHAVIHFEAIGEIAVLAVVVAI